MISPFYRWQNDDFAFASELDLLVSVYPSEDMSTLYHNYQQYGLINTIKMNCDVGLMPDHTADVITVRSTVPCDALFLGVFQ